MAETIRERCFKINDSVKIIGNIQGWTNRTGIVKDFHGVDYWIFCGLKEDDEILVMEKEIQHCNPES